MVRRSTRSSRTAEPTMPPPELPAARKRKNSAVAVKENSSLMREKLAMITSNIDLELEMRCKRLKSSAEDCVRAMRSEFQIAMMKLPKSIRQMPISEFQSKYQGTASKVKQEEIAMLRQTLDTPRQMMLRSRTIACTPASKKKIVTPARKYGTAGAQAQAGRDSAIKPRELEVTKPLKNTTEGVVPDLSLMAGEVEACTDEASRAETKEKLKAMQAQLALLMKKIDSP
eukprot:TRINITY_DN3123_c0_g1_i1.p2 TRINITY_DN3123_c0_g1~~TRINITY_DN3123_c0_g1_i1.p2  ORF type:complete len:228 (-),score=47.62 TRINITY_DN3123_c0_g1_i1:329-1012(-)